VPSLLFQAKKLLIHCRIVKWPASRVLCLYGSATLQTIKGHSNWVSSAVFSPDGDQIVSGSEDHRVGLWDAIIGASVEHSIGGLCARKQNVIKHVE